MILWIRNSELNSSELNHGCSKNQLFLVSIKLNSLRVLTGVWIECYVISNAKTEYTNKTILIRPNSNWLGALGRNVQKVCLPIKNLQIKTHQLLQGAKYSFKTAYIIFPFLIKPLSCHCSMAIPVATWPSHVSCMAILTCTPK